jgi:hypothetical protein
MGADLFRRSDHLIELLTIPPEGKFHPSQPFLPSSMKAFVGQQDSFFLTQDFLLRNKSQDALILQFNATHVPVPHLLLLV